MTRYAGSVFFLTDYGHTDEFAGVMRAVVQRHAPGAPIVDLTHDVPPFDVRAGALALCRALPHLGPGVVVAVVDPGVGTPRRAVAASVVAGGDAHAAVGVGGSGPTFFVGPDNGLLPWALDAAGGPTTVVELEGRPHGGRRGTFDGRDLFAPAAARLVQGTSLADLGPDVDPGTLVRLAPPLVSVAPGVVTAEVQWIDRFGNVQLAARPEHLAAAGLGPDIDVVVASRNTVAARSVISFSDLDPGGVGLLVDANGQAALVCDRRPAATVLDVHPGDVVTLMAARGRSGPPAGDRSGPR